MGDNSDPLIIDNFTVDDTEFSLKPLKNEARLKLLPDILGMLAPLVHTSDLEDGQIDRLIAEAIKALDRLPKLVDAFQSACKWRRSPEGKWSSQGWDVCFQRRTLLQIRWLLRCVRLEFGDFLAADGLSTLAEEVNSLTSLDS